MDGATRSVYILPEAIMEVESMAETNRGEVHVTMLVGGRVNDKA